MSTDRQAASSSTVAALNQQAIVQALRAHGPMTRQQLASTTGLSVTTVFRLTAALIDQHIVSLAGQLPSTGGRPSELLTYTGESRTVAGLNITARCADGIVLKLDGSELYRERVEFDFGDGEGANQSPPHEVRLGQTLRLFDSLLATAAENATPCLAIGVAVPGVVSGTSGEVAAVHELEWGRIGLGTILSQRATVPVLVENDANCLAIGEHARGVGQGIENLIALVVENGIGAGLVLNGRPYRGYRHEAGEIGYLLTERASLGRLFPSLGDLENRIGSIALTQRAAAAGLRVAPGDVVTAGQLIAGSIEGSGPGHDLAVEALDLIALAIAAMTTVLDPELIVVGGTLARHSRIIVPGIRERLAGRILRVPRIEPAGLGDDAILTGAAQVAASSVAEPALQLA